MRKRAREAARLEDYHHKKQRLLQCSPTNLVRSKDTEFCYESGQVWYILNKKYASSSGSREYNSSWSATEEIKGHIRDICKTARKADATFGTKQNALETLRKIGKSICLARSTLGREVRKQMQRDDALDGAMRKILMGLSVADARRIAVAELDGGKGMFVAKLKQLWAMSHGCVCSRHSSMQWLCL